MRPSLRAYAAAGDTAAVLALLDTAQRARQDSSITVADLAFEGGLELRAHGTPDRARSAFRRGLAWLEAIPGASRRPTDRLMHARLLYELGRWEDARALADSLVATAPANADYLGLSGATAARMGDSAAAQRRFNALQALPRQYSFGRASENAAHIAAVRGQRDSVVVLVRRALQEGRAFGPWLHRETDFAALRDYGPFAALMKSKD